jgi:hypothetical protein
MKLFYQQGLGLIAISLIVSHSALAQQYAWIDENGHKQFSDQPPPASVPNNKIIYSKEHTNTSSVQPADTESHPKSIAEQELSYNKKHAEQVKQEKKNQEVANQVAAQKDDCKRMADFESVLNSGERIRQNTPDGERGYMSDEERATEQRNLKQKLTECN